MENPWASEFWLHQSNSASSKQIPTIGFIDALPSLKTGEFNYNYVQSHISHPWGIISYTSSHSRSIIHNHALSVLCFASLFNFERDLNSHFWYFDWSINDNKFYMHLLLCIGFDAVHGSTVCLITCHFLAMSSSQKQKKNKFVNFNRTSAWLNEWQQMTQRNVLIVSTKHMKITERKKMLQFIINK